MTTFGVTGHQAIPPDGKEAIREGIARIFAKADQPLCAVSALAAGSDQLAATEVLRLGGRLHAIVPSAGYENAFEQAADRRRYEVLLQQAQTAEALDFEEPSEEAFWAAGKRVVELSDVLIAVWDGRPSQGLGGTADVVRFARKKGKPVEVIWPPGLSR